MILDIFVILLPLIFLAMGGYAITAFFNISEGTLIRVVTDFFMPCLIFYSLYTSDINLTSTLKMGAAVSLVVLFLMALSLIYCRVFAIDFKAFSPPVLFMNSGFLGIPLMKLWGSFSAMNIIVIYDQIQTFYIFTIGIIIVSGGFTFSGLKEMVKSPLLWSIVLGFGFRYSEIPVHDNLLRIFDYCGAGAPALAIFALGCSLRKRQIRPDPHLLSGLLMRFGFGFLAALVSSHFLNITGIERTVVIVASSLPSAVFSVVLPLRYGVEARFSGSLILLSSLLSVLWIPLVFYFSNL